MTCPCNATPAPPLPVIEQLPPGDAAEFATACALLDEARAVLVRGLSLPAALVATSSAAPYAAALVRFQESLRRAILTACR